MTNWLFDMLESFCDDCKLKGSCEGKKLMEDMMDVVMKVDEETRNRLSKQLGISIYCKDREEGR